MGYLTEQKALVSIYSFKTNDNSLKIAHFPIVMNKPKVMGLIGLYFIAQTNHAQK